MIWVAIVGGIALAGLVALVIYGVGLKHRVEALKSEADKLEAHARETSRLIDEVRGALPLRD